MLSQCAVAYDAGYRGRKTSTARRAARRHAALMQRMILIKQQRVKPTISIRTCGPHVFFTFLYLQIDVSQVSSANVYIF